jgi:parallel beta-helix repeat protein
MKHLNLSISRTHRVVFVARIGFLTALVAGVVFVAARNNISNSAAPPVRSTDQSRPSPPGEASKSRIADRYGKLPLSFEVNEGQTDKQVEFVSHGPGYDLFLTASGAVLTLRKPQTPPLDKSKSPVLPKNVSSASVLRLKMIGTNPESSVKGQDELPGKVNYLIGDDSEKWHINIPTYRKVHYKDIYPGVDMVYYGNQRQLEYDFVIAAGVNPGAIKFQLDGAERISLDDAGDLRLTVKDGELRLHKPLIYQLTDEGARREVKGEYVIKGKEIGFKVRAFDSRKPLIIDPVLSYSTLLGTGSNEQGNSIAVDAQGNAYITGLTGSAIFPTTPGAFQTTGNSGGAFVTKLDATGSNLIYSTYLSGASGQTVGTGIAVDAAGDAYVTGYTSAGDFPIFNPLRGGRNNLLITTDGGGNWIPNNVGTANRAIQTLAIDQSSPSTIYAGTGLNGGIFKSTDGGATWTALNTGVTNASCPAIVIDPTSSNILYAALIAPNFGSATGVYKSVDAGNTWTSSGINGTQVFSLAVDPQNHLTLYAGTTFGFSKSTNGGASWANANTGLNFGGASAIVIDPTTPATLYTIAGGGGVFKSTNGAGNWSQVNNGLTNTTVRALVMDPTAPSTLYAGTAGGGVFKTSNAGASWSAVNNGPSLSTANMSSLAIVPPSTTTVFAGTFDGRILKTTNAGGSWSVVYTTTTNTGIRALAIDSSSPAKVVAAVDSTSQTLNSPDAFVTKLNPSGSGLLYSTFVGGLLDDEANAIAIDASGNAYIAGQTTSFDYPAVNAAQAAFAGPTGCSGDGFVTKLNSSGSALSFSTYLGGTDCDKARAIALDNLGNVYVAGETLSSNLATPGAFQTALAVPSQRDAFAARFTTNGAVGYFTYLGGNGDDIAYGIATDTSGSAYVTGLTTSTNFPTANPIQATNGGSAGDAFVTKINTTGSALVYSTYLGGSTVDAGRGIAVDSAGSAYVTGVTGSSEFPLVAGALRTKSPFFKSIDGGANWNNDNYGLKVGNITTIVVNAASPSTIFAGSFGKLHKSTDGGRNWAPSMTGLVNPTVRALAINPANPSIMYLASDATDSGASRGVFKSNDGGNSWNPANNGLGITPQAIYVVIDPVTPSTLYAGVFGSLFKSIDSGGTWNRIGPQFFSAVALAIDPVTPTTLYSADNNSGGKVSKSTDGGANWQVVGNGYTGSGASFLAINPQTPSTVYASGFNGGLFKTVDGGANWISINVGLGGPIAIDPVNTSTVYGSSSSTGVFKSTDAGSTFTALSKAPALIFSVVINPITTTTLYGVSNPGDEDAFVSKLSASGTSLIYSTLLGGTRAPLDSLNYNDIAFAIALDSTGNAYITGVSRSPDFPVNANSYQPFNRGFDDAFVAKLTASYIIGGQVLDTNNAPVAGVEVTLSDGSSLTSVLTESDGSYQFSRLREGGSFTVSAAKPHFTMAPASQTFNNLTSNQTVNFIATATNAPFYTISGQVTNNAVGLSGVTVTLSGSQSGLRTTDSNGNYSFELAGSGNYTVTPSILGFTFSPPNQTFSNLSANQTANFAATREDFVVTNTKNHGTGSLRQAILNANATVGPDRIVFNITGSGVQTINLLIALPEITDPVVIDATTQPGFAGAPLVELNGASAGSGASGFVISSGSSTVRGFVINRFSSGTGIALRTNGNNLIQGNYIGIDATGTLKRANSNGITISNCSNNTIGGTTASARNIISGNTFDGISINGAGNQVQGNFIGTNAAGTAGIDYGTYGVEVFGSAASTNNVIGGTVPGAGNLISGNSTGVRTSSPGNSIQGNLIGTDLSGKLAVGNLTGVMADGANGLVGGTVPGARNVISGNTSDGITIIGAGSRLQGNLIGTDITGTVALGNGGNGVVAGTGALVGGTTPEARNVISGNGGFGNVSVGSNSSGNSAVVQGNYIGTDISGTVALNNPQAGVSISSSSNLIGGLTPGAQNVISGNRIGIQIGGSVSNTLTGNVVQGNIVGLNAPGTAPLANTSAGIIITNSSSSTIGGIQSEAANRISSNGGPGVSVSSGTGNSIRGNSILSNVGLGIDLSPTGVTANDPGDADTGANNRQNFPVLTSVLSNGGSTTVQGTLNSTPNTTFTIDFYSNIACDPSGNGEGAQFFNTTTVTTAGDGNVALNVTFPMALAPGTVVTSAATDPLGNTSEFSRCVATPVPLSINDVSIAEGNSGTTNAVFTVTLSNASGLPVVVDFASANGTATAPSDYTAITTTTLTFNPGELAKTITVLVNGNTNAEPDETFFVNLTNAVNATITDSQGVGTILNDDPLYLILDESGPAANQATAFESILFTRDPFRVRGIAEWLDLGADRNTRVVIFAANLQLNPGEPASTVMVNLVGSNNQIYDVPAEEVRPLPNSAFTQITFRLPDSLATGACTVTIRAYNQTSNTGSFRIVP